MKPNLFVADQEPIHSLEKRSAPTTCSESRVLPKRGDVPIRVLIVDDFELWRGQVCGLIQAKTEIEVIGEASDGPQGVQKADDLKPDLILLDVGLPMLSGIEAALRIRKLSPCSRIIFLSMNSDPDIVQGALDTGALGYVHKTSAAGELIDAVDAVLRGEQFVSDCLKGRNAVPIMPRMSHI